MTRACDRLCVCSETMGRSEACCPLLETMAQRGDLWAMETGVYAGLLVADRDRHLVDCQLTHQLWDGPFNTLLHGELEVIH